MKIVTAGITLRGRNGGPWLPCWEWHVAGSEPSRPSCIGLKPEGNSSEGSRLMAAQAASILEVASSAAGTKGFLKNARETHTSAPGRG